MNHQEAKDALNKAVQAHAKLVAEQKAEIAALKAKHAAALKPLRRAIVAATNRVGSVARAEAKAEAAGK